jgi:P-type conjugative transfer protein TrbJ
VFARQLQQLQQETATVTNLAQQLQYAIKNTTGGGAGVWKSNQNLLTNLGDLINQQEGLAYTFQGLTQQFQQLYPGYNARPRESRVRRSPSRPRSTPSMARWPPPRRKPRTSKLNRPPSKTLN